MREIAGESLIVLRDERGESQSLLQRLPASGNAARRSMLGPVRFDHSVSLSRLDVRFGWPSGGGAADGPWQTSGVEDYPLASIAADVWDGHIFLNLVENPPPLEEQLDGLDERFATWGMGELRWASA